MKEIDCFRKHLIALTLAAAVAVAGCADGDEGMIGDERLDDDGLGGGAQVEPAPGQTQPGQTRPGTETQEMAQRMGAAAPFEELDVNDDDRVTQDEFRAYAQQQGVFQRWDEDRNGSINEAEFRRIGIDSETGDFETWDEDGNGSLSVEEFFGSVFGAWDDNEDGHWDGGDWDDAGDSGLFDI